jgi:hypothetical protein
MDLIATALASAQFTPPDPPRSRGGTRASRLVRVVTTSLPAGGEGMRVG